VAFGPLLPNKLIDWLTEKALPDFLAGFWGRREKESEAKGREEWIPIKFEGEGIDAPSCT